MDSQDWLVYFDSQFYKLQVNKTVLSQILQQEQKYKLIIYLKQQLQQEQEQQYYGLRINHNVQQNQFIIIDYLCPVKTVYNKTVEFVNLLCPILATFIIFEQSSNNLLKQSLIKFGEFDRSFLPNGYQISQLNIQEEEQLVDLNKKSIKEVLQNLHEIYLNSEDNLDYIVNQFLINSYQYKRIKSYGIDNSTNFKRFIGFVFKNVEKYIESGLYKYVKKLEYEKICNGMAVAEVVQGLVEGLKLDNDQDKCQLVEKQLEQYQRLADKMEIRLDEQQKYKLKMKMEKQLGIGFDHDKQDEFQFNIQTFRSNSHSVYAGNSQLVCKGDNVLQPDVSFFNNKEQKDQEDCFEEVLEKEFSVIRQKLVKNEYQNYESYGNDLEIFINFCFDNILELQCGEDESKIYLDSNEFWKIKYLQQFMMKVNKEGTQHFIKRIQSQNQFVSIQESIHMNTNTNTNMKNMNMNNSQDDLTIIQDQDWRLENLMSNVQDWQLKLQQSFNLMNYQVEMESRQQLQNNYLELEMKGRLMESVIRNQYQQIQKQKQMVRKQKVGSCDVDNVSNNQKYFCDRIIELENEVEELRVRKEGEQKNFEIKEKKYQEQIERVNNMMNQLSMQNIKNSKEMSQEKQELSQRETESIKMINQLNRRVEVLEQDKRKLLEEGREKKQQQELFQKQNMVQQQEQLETISGLQKKIQDQREMLEQLQKERKIDVEFIQQNDNMKIYKEMNRKLELENEKLIDEVNETLITIKDYSVQIESYQRQIKEQIEKEEQYENRVQELNLNWQESRQQYLELENGYIQQIQQLKVDYEQEIQGLNKENVDLKENYELRIQKIKKQITQNNPFMNIDDNLNISNNEQTMQNMNSSLINLINQQHNQSNVNNSRLNKNESLDIFNNSKNNVLEGKVIDYQNKLKTMQEEKNQLLVKVDEVYQKYIEANFKQY